jgi:hypothetical protein
LKLEKIFYGSALTLPKHCQSKERLARTLRGGQQARGMALLCAGERR